MNLHLGKGKRIVGNNMKARHQIMQHDVNMFIYVALEVASVIMSACCLMMPSLLSFTLEHTGRVLHRVSRCLSNVLLIKWTWEMKKFVIPVFSCSDCFFSDSFVKLSILYIIKSQTTHSSVASGVWSWQVVKYICIGQERLMSLVELTVDTVQTPDCVSHHTHIWWHWH